MAQMQSALWTIVELNFTISTIPVEKPSMISNHDFQLAEPAHYADLSGGHHLTILLSLPALPHATTVSPGDRPQKHV
jgi:hypothetical protein